VAPLLLAFGLSACSNGEGSDSALDVEQVTFANQMSFVSANIAGNIAGNINWSTWDDSLTSLSWDFVELSHELGLSSVRTTPVTTAPP
jgi:hypothetical protein